MTTTTPMVSVRGVHKFFGDLHVLRGIDLDIASGEVCVILGPSGSGKSTLLRCLNMLEDISAGRVYVDGELLGYREYAGGALFERLRTWTGASMTFSSAVLCGKRLKR